MYHHTKLSHPHDLAPCICALLLVTLNQQHKNPTHQRAPIPKFCTVASKICGSVVLNLPHVTFQAPTIFKWLPDLKKKIYTSLQQTKYKSYLE